MSLSDFVLQSKIGEGAYSSVHKAKRSSDGVTYALKKVRLQTFRFASAISTRRKKKMPSTKYASSPPSAQTILSSTSRLFLTPTPIHYASSWNSQKEVTSKYHSHHIESHRKEEENHVLGRRKGNMDHDGSSPQWNSSTT